VTAAGERLLQSVGHRIDEIEAELDMLTALRDKPAGTVRITCGPNVLKTTLLPKLTPLLREYPDIHIEFDANHGSGISLRIVLMPACGSETLSTKI
jgi:DNA-binding transcriptional LysR family regulator